jgi:beta-glucosidase
VSRPAVRGRSPPPPRHIAAAELATSERNAPYLTAIMEGRYRESFLAAADADAPKVDAED